MTPDWIDLGPLDDLPEGKPVLRKDEAGKRYVCVRSGACVDALDDRCPHQGYPLSQGSVQGGVLTCDWHNWKFDLASGGCTFGGEAVKRFPTRVEGGRVHLDRAIDRGAEARRFLGGLREALRRDEIPRALREGLRLGALGIGAEGTDLGALHAAFEVLAHDGAERAEYGFDHGLAVTADLCSWAARGWISAEEAFAAAAHAVAEPSLHLGARGAQRPGVAGDPRQSLARMVEVDPTETALVGEALAAERRDEAEARVREIVESRGPDGAVAALMPFLARHLYDYGHGAIFTAKALELARRFPAAASELLGAVTVTLAWALADTALPPFAATRASLARLAETRLPVIDGGSLSAALSSAPKPPEGEARPLDDRPGYEAAVLAGEPSAAQATVARLAEGCAPVTLLRAIGHAAAVRLRRFDSAWERRLDAEVGVLDVSHAVTFVEAAISLSGERATTARQASQLAVLAAGFVGKLRKADAADPVKAAGAAGGDLREAAAARDVGRALAAIQGLDGPARLLAYAEIAPFAALDAAVRPIFYAHTVKNTEALRRLEAGDPEADGAYLEALVAYLVPIRPESRMRRTAAVATKFLRDGRPPEGLY
jgi:nitrite reductase/ring-hydroxylating ferredoxin subunit